MAVFVIPAEFTLSLPKWVGIQGADSKASKAQKTPDPSLWHGMAQSREIIKGKTRGSINRTTCEFLICEYVKIGIRRTKKISPEIEAQGPVSKRVHPWFCKRC